MSPKNFSKLFSNYKSNLDFNSIEEITPKNFNKNMMSPINFSKLFSNYNPNLENNNLSKDKNNYFNKNENQNITIENIYAPNSGHNEEKSESQKTINFEKDFNFNYDTLQIENSPFHVKNYKHDFKSYDEIYSNYSNMKIRIKSSKLNQNQLIINNVDKNESFSASSFEKSSCENLDTPHNKKKSNLIYFKNNVNKNILANLTSYKKFNFNNDLQIYNKKFLDEVRILVVDDEKLIRKSNINLLTKFFKNKNLNFQAYECEDGFDCLNYIYQGKIVGINFDYIITDQTMNFITGNMLSDIINLLQEKKVLKEIKIFLLTSYSVNLFEDKKYIFSRVFSKPLKTNYLELMFKDLIFE